MQSPRGVKIDQKLEKLKDSFESYLRPLIDEWIRDVPDIIREKIVNPLFTVDGNKMIGLNFAKEVIILYY